MESPRGDLATSGHCAAAPVPITATDSSSRKSAPRNASERVHCNGRLVKQRAATGCRQARSRSNGFQRCSSVAELAELPLVAFPKQGCV